MQKYVFWKLDLNVKRQYFRYKEYINWLQIDEILTYAFMYGVLPSRFCGRSTYKPMWLFLTCSLAWKRVLTIFLHGGTTCLWKLNFFDIQCVVEALSSSLNHNMTLERKENYPQHTKTVQNSLGFVKEVKALHKLCGGLVLCTLEVCGYSDLFFQKTWTKGHWPQDDLWP